jgi:hypothetical protein
MKRDLACNMATSLKLCNSLFSICHGADSGTAESGFRRAPLAGSSERQALATPVAAVAMPIPTLSSAGRTPWNLDEHKLSALAKGRLVRNEPNDTEKKWLLTMKTSQAATNLDNLAARMVMGLRPL